MNLQFPRGKAVLLLVVLFGMAVFSDSADAQKIGPEFRANTHTNGDQMFPAVAINTVGRFVVVWASEGQDGSGMGVFGQRFFPNGVKAGAEFQVNDYTENDQDRPSVAIRDDGSYIVTWQSRDQDGDGNGIFARIFTSSGTRLGTEFQVNTYTFSNESVPHVALDGLGNFWIAWQSTQQDGSSDATMMRKYDADGVPLTAEVMVNRYTYGFQGIPRIGCDASGNPVVTYTSMEFDGDGYAAAVQRMNATGGLVGPELIANTFTVNHQDYPGIAVNPDGSFVVVWHSAMQDGNGYGVYGQRYNSNGTRAGGEFQINQETYFNQWWTEAAADDFGSFAVVWETYTRDGRNDIFLRRYHKDGTPHSGESRVNSFLGEDQEKPDITSRPDGNLVVVWQSRNQDGSGYGIYGQRFTAGTVPVVFSGLSADVAGGSVTLRWNIDSDEPLNELVILRESQDGDYPATVSIPDGARSYRDTPGRPGIYTYSVIAKCESGNEFRSRGINVSVGPAEVELFQNHPNPFNPSTLIVYQLDVERQVELSVYDVRGGRVADLVNEIKPAGKHEVLWDGRNSSGTAVGSGVYFCRLKSGKTNITRRMLLLK
jgi:hypothetical protein